MRTSWLRFGITSLMGLSAVFAAALVACSDDDDKGSPAQTNDSGADTSTPETDAGSDATTPPKKQPAKLQLVNAATDMGPDLHSGFLRFCYEVAPNVFAPLPPLPDQKVNEQLPFAGVPIGTGGTVDATGADLSALAITPYLMNAESLAARGIVRGTSGTTGMTCSEIIGPDKNPMDSGSPLVENKDYWKLPTIPVGTFLADKSFALVLTGCVANTEIEDTDKCGAGFTATGIGNLKIGVYELDRTTAIDATKIGTQFIHASPAGALKLAGAGGAIPAYVSADGGVTPATAAPADGGVPVNSLTGLLQVEGVDVATAKFTVNNADPNLAIPLATIQQLSALPADAGYRNGAAFTFIALGDPDEDAMVENNFNTKTFHYIALPNDPVVGVYK